MAPSGMVPKSSRVWIKWVVSLRYDLPFGEISLRKKSTKEDIRSEGHPLPDIMGLPGGGKVPLCIFGSI